MSTLAQIAEEIGRLRTGGVARFHFDPRHRTPRPLSDARLDAWTARHLETVEARAAIFSAMIADANAPNVEKGERVPMANEVSGMARVALRSIEGEFAELGVEMDGHAAVDAMLSTFVFHLVRMVAAERVIKAGVRPGGGDPCIDALLADGFDAMQSRAVVLRGMIIRLLRTEAAMNLTYDSILDGDVEAMRGGLAAVLDEMPGDDPVRGSITRVLKAVEGSGEKSP